MKRQILAVAVGLAAMTFGAGAQAQQQTVKFGALIPVTGPSAPIGAAVTAGGGGAVKEINDNGGILGRRIEFITADDGNNPTQGVSEARRLAQIEKVTFVVGSFNSSVTTASFPVFTEAKILQFSSTGAKEASAAAGPYHFSTISSNAKAQAENFVDYAVNIAKVKTAAILSDTTPLYKSVVEEIHVAAQKAGLKITGVNEFEVRTTDLSPQLLALRRGNPDLLWVIGILPGDAATSMKGLAEIGWNVRLAVGLGAGAQPSGIARAMAPSPIPDYVGQVFRSYTFCPGDAVGQSSVPKTLAFLKERVPDFEKQFPFVLVSAYDAVHIAKQVYEAVGSFDNEKAAKWIEGNADRIKSVAQTFVKPSGGTHFLLGPDSMAMALNPHITRADGLTQRFGC
jgi:ABC-type branched-subunit amino acid transport system substrate-binding protein